ncbi:MAG: response regulator [Burkholderiales bacterium]|nr:response regulator [Burkholderiales bacterium]
MNKILLVEDNPNDADLAKMAISRTPFTGLVTHLEDGVAAVEYLTRPDAQLPLVVLLDLKLPRLNGLEVLKQVKNHPGCANVPVVMLTSSRELADIEESYRLGVNSYVVKPVNFDDYQRVIRELIGYWTDINQPPLATA